MTSKLMLMIGFLSISFNTFAQQYDQIKDYKASTSIAKNGSKQFVAIRSFSNHNQKYLLLVDVETLNTKIDLASKYRLNDLDYGNLLTVFKNAPYVNSLEVADINQSQLQNAGLDHSIPKEKGIALTIDLCPSHKALDRIIFQSIFDEFKKVEQPAPVAISLSGKWIMKHQDDLSWLKSLVDKNELNITWVNHTYNHEVNSLPLAQNFLLSKGTNIDIEVLENEKLMLRNGITPSVFFRFPGLVSDKEVFDKIEKYGLIPIGSDAWLAKGQQAHSGSIVLIHGNGNEEIGVKDFLQLLKTKQVDISGKQWLLFDLRQGLEKAYR